MSREIEDLRIEEIDQFLWKGFQIKPNAHEVYDEAFTHSTCGSPNNQKLAFLGDRVFDLVVGQLLFRKHPDLEKGRLTSELRDIHDEHFQAEVARRIDLIEPMIFGETYRDNEKSDLEKRDGIMEEVLEAFFAAVYLDQGIDKAIEVADSIVF
ncbi:MAG: ribonuclease III domain-containing protein [Candidatus Thorarchaeota archaeon]|jgi:ribonuclease-3